MKWDRWVRPMPVAVGLLAAFWILFSATRVKSVHAADETAVFQHLTIYTSPTKPPIKHGVIVIRGGRIAAVGPAGQVGMPAGVKPIGCSECFITAGFQNSHVHFELGKWDDPAHQPAKELRQHLEDMLTRYGVTTAVDLGSMLQNTVAIRQRIESGEVRGPRILTAGGPLFPPDGIPYYVCDKLPAEFLQYLAQPATPEAAVGFVDSNLAGGADVIKLFTGSLVGHGKVKPMPQDVATAAVAEAHRRGRLVFTHPSNMEGLTIAVNAGVDVLAHTTPMSGKWDAALTARMKERHIALVPTLQLWISEAKAAGDSDAEAVEFADRGVDELRDYARAGGQILFGTDVGYQDNYSPQKEYELMARAGMTPMQILASLTTAPAERLGEANKRGRIAVGLDADLVLLDADPAKDAKNLTRVCATFRKGQMIYATGSFETGGAVGLCPHISTEGIHP
jgi:imidazolonepropionase-like amidohydrolase